MYRIMLVEDDKIISKAIKDNLVQWNYEVMITTDFQNVLEEFVDYKPHLVLMDITLPFYNGYHWCQEIRKTSNIPIIFISSAGENMNIVMAMNLGGDDYIQKPFDLNVLEAKIQAILRRSYDLSMESERVEFQGVSLDLSEMTVYYDGKSAALTKNEFKILEGILKKKGVVSREELMEKLWKSDEYIDDNTLTVNVGRLRKTLSSLGLEDFIHTKKGVGYYAEKK
ncbi:MAG: response regulator transcription factor [Gallicola sp.]|nr:response regulator transcription factor [Gallicola sp.]